MGKVTREKDGTGAWSTVSEQSVVDSPIHDGPLDVQIGVSDSGLTVTVNGQRVLGVDYPGVSSLGVGLDFPNEDATIYFNVGLLQWVNATETAVLTQTNGNSGSVALGDQSANPIVQVKGDGSLGFFGTDPAVNTPATVTDAPSLIAALAALGLVVDGT